ncbi:MAG: Fic family protein [Desulfovibrio sp.]
MNPVDYRLCLNKALQKNRGLPSSDSGWLAMIRYNSNQSDPYAASNGVLLNLLEITRQDDLDMAERLFVAWRETNLSRIFTYDAQLLNRIHHHLFQDLYSWAGQYRTVNISKGEAPFAPPQHIAASIMALVEKYPLKTLNVATPEKFADLLAEITSEYNAIHPFREGNGRSIRALAVLLAEHCGHSLNWTPVTREQWTKASVNSFYGSAECMERLVRQAMGLLAE